MGITYDHYPLLDMVEKKVEILLSENHPFGSFSITGTNFLNTNSLLHFLVESLTTRCDDYDPNRSVHFYLNGKTVQAINMKWIYSKEPNLAGLRRTMEGVILLEESLQLLYQVIPRLAEDKIKYNSGYISVALFKGTNIGAFEKGVFGRGVSGEVYGRNKLVFDRNARFDDINMFGAGGYLKFVMEVLDTIQSMDNIHLVAPSFNKTALLIQQVTMPEMDNA